MRRNVCTPDARLPGITLIGMPTSGKSSVGKLLAERLGFDYLDLDVYISEKEGKAIPDLVRAGTLNVLEDSYAQTIRTENMVIAPGGSIVFAKHAMAFLRAKTTIFFLDVSLDEIKRRLAVSADRGIVGLKSKSIDRLYEERRPLYRKYSHYVCASTRWPASQCVQEICRMLH